MNQMTEHDRDGVVFRTADAFTEAGGVIHAFSTRFGGVSDGIWTSMNLGTTRGDDPDRVRENYRRFFEAAGANLKGVVMSNQVHGTEIRVATAQDVKKDLYDPEGYEVDGLMTDVPGLALVIFSADCLPVLLYDPVKKAVCAVHGGWRGTVAGIAPKGVRQLGEVYGSRPEDILAVIGPGISGCHFETHSDVPEAVMRVLPPEKSRMCIRGYTQNKFHVDLKAVNRFLLMEAGVPAANITVDPDCTVCRPDKYFSHRQTGGARGSLAAVIQLG